MRWRSVYLLSLLIAGSASAAHVTAVEAIALPVASLERSVAFYTEVLAFEKVNESQVTDRSYARIHDLHHGRPRLAWLRLGEEYLVLADYSPATGRAVPADSRSNDRWFQHVAIIVNNMEKAYARLESYHVAHASTAPQTLPSWNKSAGGIKAYYFKDPDGHSLEILQFPDGKGQAKWHQASDKLFLGIDHTAIVVGSTAESLRFWRDQLGMEVKGESENYGPEQERLNNVAGAHLRITGLRAASGPGIEFLEYLAPTDGRPYPQKSRANDLWQWETLLIATGVGDKTLMVRDPDGHAVELVEKIHAQN